MMNTAHAAVIRQAIISATDRDDLVPAAFDCLVENHGIDAVTEAGFPTADEFAALVEVCAVAMNDAKAA